MVFHRWDMVHVLDNYYLAITALVTIVYQLLFFAVAFTFKFDKLTDFAGGTNFALVALLTLGLSRGHDARQLVATLFLTVWALRLSGFLFFRILKTGKDDRFDDKRDKFFAFLGFWIFQMIWVWTVSLPVTVLNSPNVQWYRQPAFGTGLDIAGVILFAVGFVMEAVSDAQRYRFRRDRKDGGAILDTGFFAWSRHPNYFGEMLIQFSIWMTCISPAAWGGLSKSTAAALYATVVGPVLLTALLMFVSGLTLSERPAAKKRYEQELNWDAYRAYLDRTSILIPFPPQLYRPLPTVLKRTLFLEFPLYVFDPAKHSGGPATQGKRPESRSVLSREGGAAAEEDGARRPLDPERGERVSVDEEPVRADEP